MRVAIDCTVLHGRFSGVEKSVRGFLRGLAEVAAEEDEYLLVCGREIPLEEALPPQFRWIPGAFRAEDKVRRVLFQQLGLSALARRLGADLLHGPAYVTPIRPSVATVATVHDLMVFLYPELCSKANVLHYRAVMRRSLPRCDRLIVTSHAVARSVTEVLGIPATRMTIAPLGVDECYRQPVADDAVSDLRRRLALPEAFALFLGNLEPKKGLSTLLRALGWARKRGVEIPLVLAGKRAWGMAGLEEEVERAGVRDLVRPLGYIPDADLPALYRCATFFVFPSIYEGFGLPPLEAMSCGTPVLVSEGGALPEVTGEAALRVPVGDVEALGEAMIRLFTNADLRERLRTLGWKQAEAYSWRTHAQIVRSVYAEVQRGQSS